MVPELSKLILCTDFRPSALIPNVVANTRPVDRNSIAYERRLTGIDFKVIYRTGNNPPGATKYKSTDDGDTSRVFITSIRECNEEVLGTVGK
jgi:hypothetical protein